MKRFVPFVLGLVVSVCAVTASAEETTYPGPQEAAPNVYKQLFDNEKVRVSEITFEPGAKAAMHTHAYAHSVYVIEGGELTLTHPDGTSSKAVIKAGDVIWFEPETHEAVNTGTTKVRGTVTELK